MPQRNFQLPAAALFLLLVTIIIKSAWLGDDAFISFRSIDNMLNGYGLRWNIDERVQVFTDPLWKLTIAIFYAFTHEIFITAIVLCIVVSVAAIFVLVKYVSASSAAATASLVVLISSKAFVDYTTSGLENPLNYLLLALFCIPFLRQPLTRKAFRGLVLFYALVGFNRLDLLLLLFPAVAITAWTLYRARTLTLRSLLLDALLWSAPLWGWLLFATVYYGYAFPNTYYAKLYTGIAPIEHIKQGLLYYINSINSDPATLLLIVLTIGIALANRDWRLKAGGLGLVLYLLYVVKIGGDFMSGRFFSVPFFFAVLLLVQIPLRRAAWLGLALVCFLTGLSAKYPPLFYNEEYKGVVENPDPASRTSDVTDRRGIADERGWYFRNVGLITVLTRYQTKPPHPWANAGMEARANHVDLVEFGTPGLYGYYAGPGVHIIDTYGLGDPLLARLPVFDPTYWKVGHYGRAVPVGYIETVQSGSNKVRDPAIRELYRVAKILTRDPIWSWERLKEIVKANLGYYNSLIRSAPRAGAGPPLSVGQLITLAPRDAHRPLYQYGTPIIFNTSGMWDQYRGQGWCGPEEHYTWTDGSVASVVFPLTKSDEPVTLIVRTGGNIRPPSLPFQPVDVLVNDRKIASWEVADDKVYIATIPKDFLTEPRNNLYIDFSIPKAISPTDLGTGADGRRLGMRVSEVTITRAQAP